MNKLIIADSEDADMYYATGVLVPDSFVYVTLGKKKYVIVSSLEYSRVKEEIKKGITVLGWDGLYDTARDHFGTLGLAAIAYAFLKKHRVRSVVVPPNFSLKFADGLRALKIGVHVEDPFFVERRIKSKAEIEAIKHVQKITEKACKKAIAMVRESTVGRGRALYLDGKKLTSERIKEEIHTLFMKHSLECPEVIIASGVQSAQPHNRGSGPIKAGEPLIMDIFPRSLESRYYSDMTRTICKGTPVNPLVSKMYKYVHEAQAAGYAVVREGATGADVHEAVVDVFRKYGMENYFIHSTGHGVGIDIHEYPGVSVRGPLLKAGMVITNEPGLYVPGVGGVRIEDTLVVTKKGYENLAKGMHKKFIV